jgi:transketolase
MNSLLKLEQCGQSYWLDNLTRAMISSGELRQRATEQGLRGVTSNPAIFQKAIAGSADYDEQIQRLVDEGHSTPEIYEELVTTDVRDACDTLRPVYDQTDGVDGYVSLEVSPHLAHDTRASIEEARRLHRRVDRPNLLIKIPGTSAGLVAIEELLFEGIPVNITLLFSVDRYAAVAEAYMRALERRAASGHSLAGLASVASFFLSRIDVLVDQLLGHRITPTSTAEGTPVAQQLLGRVAIANARLAYQRFRAIIDSERWRKLAGAGARVQRLLWASTSTKNPDYSDVMYVEPLIGPDTVNTMPEVTIAAFADHGSVRPTLEEGIREAHQLMENLNAVSIDFEQVAEQLLNEGIQKFIDPYDALMDSLDARCLRFRNRRAAPALARVAKRLRRLVLRMTTAAGSGHPTSCLSAADVVAALFFHTMRWDPGDPDARDVDRFILSKGHAAPLLWAVLAEAGAIEEDPLSLRRVDSSLEGHPTPNNPWVKVATGSLGQGLAAANGMALADRLDGVDARIFCLLGDGECSEGSVWEAAQFASLQSLSNLVAIVDLNALGQSGPTPYRHDSSVFARRFESFGWQVRVIDGHDLEAILGALDAAERTQAPLAIIACTQKGKGVSFLEGKQGWHGKALDADMLERALDEIGETEEGLEVRPRRLGRVPPVPRDGHATLHVDEYHPGDAVATRTAFGNALRKLADLDPRVVVLDGDVMNSTHTEDFAKAAPERFFQGYIAEQNMVGTALGLAVNGKLPVAATFACFLSRAADFVRMAGHTRPPHLVLCGSHAGVSIGEDGPSQMGLEDLALFRAVLGSTVLYPSDAVAAERLTALAAATPGIVYIRTTRPKTPVIYTTEEDFVVGGSKTLRSSAQDRVSLIAAGITVHEALAAHDALSASGVASRVIDAFSVKPLDETTLAHAARETGLLLVVEDHFAEGGLGEAVAGAVGELAPVHRLAVRTHPRSASQSEQLARHGIDRQSIEQRVLELVKGRTASHAGQA